MQISLRQRNCIACLALIGFVFPGVALSQDMIEELREEFTPDCLISDDYVPDLIGDSELVRTGRENGILCEPVAEEEIIPAPEGLEMYDATGGTERRQAEAEVVEQLNEGPTFDFASLLPAPLRPNNGSEEETRTDFGFRDRPIEPINDDSSLVEASDEFEFDFDAQMAAGRATAPSNSLSDPFSDQSRPTQSGPVEIGDIYAAREQIALDNARQTFREQNQRIQGQCECVYTSLSCFSEPNYDYSELNDRLAGADADFEFQKDKVCKDYNDWGTRVAVDQIDDIEQINALVGTTNTVLSNLASLNNAHSNVLDDLRNAETQIANQIRREEQARQAAIAAQQNSGPSGWQIAGQVLEQFGAQTGDIYSEVGGAFVQDVTSGGSGTSLANILQDNGYGSSPSYQIETPNYDGYDSSYDSGYASAMDNVQVYEAPAAQNPVPAYGSPNPGIGATSSAAGNYGILIYGIDGNHGSLLVTSKSSADQAYADAYNQCGALCNGPMLHTNIGPGECVALVRGGRTMAEATLYLQTRSSLSAATEAAGQDCADAREASGYGFVFTCTVQDSGCN